LLFYSHSVTAARHKQVCALRTRSSIESELSEAVTQPTKFLSPLASERRLHLEGLLRHTLSKERNSNSDPQTGVLAAVNRERNER
jgi:hypothetical protein